MVAIRNDYNTIIIFFLKYNKQVKGKPTIENKLMKTV